MIIKKNVLRVFFSIFLMGILFSAPINALTADEQSNSAGDYNVLRIEHENQLIIPPELADDVWDYLVNKYVTDKTYLKSLDPQFDSYWDNEYFFDTYYDTPTLQMLGKDSGIRHRKRWNLDDPSNRKNGRELVQVKLSNIDNITLNRGEIKFPVKYPKKLKKGDDTHPLIGVIELEQRENFKKRMAELNIDPYSLRKILNEAQLRRSMYITKDGNAFISIRLDQSSSKLLWVKWEHVGLEPELNEIPYTEGTAAERKYLEDTNQKIVDDILNKFPQMKQDRTPKYSKAMSYFESKIPFFRFLIKWGFI